MIAPTVSTSDNPSPLELIFAKKIRDALEHADYLREAKKCLGVFGIQSAKDPQAVTIHCERNHIRLETGISKACQVVITTDLDNPNAKPSVKGLLRYPKLAFSVGKLLEFPSANWSDALKRLWEQHHEKPGMPSGITVRCLDEDRQLSVGNAELSPCYLEGNANKLAEAFSGEGPFIQYLSLGQIRGRFTFEQVTTLSDVTFYMMLGET